MYSRARAQTRALLLRTRRPTRPPLRHGCVVCHRNRLAGDVRKLLEPIEWWDLSGLEAVAWYALFARQFTKALTVADRAHALLPDDLTIETNRVHALMFLGRKEESKALYLAYKGKPVLVQDARPWEHVIAEDFAEFRKAGLTHPMMAEIEKGLGVSR